MKVSRLVSVEELLVLLNLNTKLFLIGKILLKQFFSSLLHPLKLETPPMVLSNGNVFKITLIPQWTYSLLVRKIRSFSHEKVVIKESDACRWFYAAIYATQVYRIIVPPPPPPFPIINFLKIFQPSQFYSNPPYY